MKQEIIKSEVTIRELSQKCGASIATISRILNGNYNPDRALHRKVREVIADANYKSQKRVKAIRNILCLSCQKPKEWEHTFAITKAIEEYAIYNRFNAVVSSTNNPDQMEKLIQAYNIKGIISTIRPLVKLSVPVILVNQDSMDDGEYTSVGSNNFAGIVAAFKYFKEMGHRRVSYFCDMEESLTAFDTNARLRLIPAAYKVAGLDFDPSLVFYSSFEPGKHRPYVAKCVEKILAMKNPPTALMLAGDCYAGDFYNCFKKNGLRIPDDISMIGFDDNPMALELTPRLTDVRKPLEIIAAEALQQLGKVISGESKSAYRIMINPELIIRDSVKKI